MNSRDPRTSRPQLSLGFRTDLIFHRFDGEVIDRGAYWVVRTPSNAGFHYGNFLLFFEAPKTGVLSRWKSLFREEFSGFPDVKHFTFLWDSPAEGAGDCSELLAAEFKLESSVILTARSVHPAPRSNSQIEVRPITTDSEWRMVVESQIHSKDSEYSETSYREFKERQMARYRAMSERGLGHWFGAFLGDRLAGDLGLYLDGDVGRFQSVETHPEFRRQGICGRLVYEAARFGFQKMGLRELVMVADEHYDAAKIYESVGFVPAAKEYSASWWDRGVKS
jgi:GNAT superfamily N-acetyltransferase